MGKSLKDSKALLMNLIHGTALPEHLAKPRTDGIDRKVIQKQVEEKLVRAPLIAVCHNHTCRCGNSWQSFGFYARRVTESIPGMADATFTKPLSYQPYDERVSETIWRPVEEQACLNCYGGASLIIAKGAANG